MALKVQPRFDFTTPIPAPGIGQNHTLAKVPNNNLAPTKFNEYERVMVELSDAVGDYGLSTVIPGAQDNLGSGLLKVWEYVSTNIPDHGSRIEQLEDDLANLEVQHNSDVSDLTSLIGTNYNSLNTAKFDKAGGTITGATKMNSILEVDGAVTLNSSLSVDTSVAVGTTLSVGSSATIGNGLTVNNATLVANAGLSVTGTGSITSNLTVGGKLTVNGALGLAVAAGSVSVFGSVQAGSFGSFGGDLSATGAITGHSLYIVWAGGRTYAVGYLVVYNGILYRCISAHTSGGVFDPAKWTSAESTPADGSITESKIEANFLKDIKADPIGTVKMYDGAVWSDNSTIPGWYACTGAGGTPDLRDCFVMAGSIADRGYTGGANAGGNKHNIQLTSTQLPTHVHTIAHTHSVAIDHNHASFVASTYNGGTHVHTVPVDTGAVGTDTVIALTNTGTVGGTVNTDTEADHTHGIPIDVPSHSESKTTGASSAADSGNGPGTGALVNITPYYYKILFIKRMA